MANLHNINAAPQIHSGDATATAGTVGRGHMPLVCQQRQSLEVVAKGRMTNNIQGGAACDGLQLCSSVKQVECSWIECLAQ